MKPTTVKMHAIVPEAFTIAQFDEMLHKGLVVDGRGGGLVLGRSFDEGGVFVIMRVGTGYVIHSQIEGGCYVLNKETSAANYINLHDINATIAAMEADRPPDYQASGISRFLTTTACPDDKLLWLDWSQIVVSREFVADHLADLEALNQAKNPYAKCDLVDHFQPYRDAGPLFEPGAN